MNKFTSLFSFPYTSPSPLFFSSLWQVSLLHWCSTWHWRCPLHVLPLLYLRPDRKMPCSDNPAVQAPHCGVDELCDYIPVSQKGAFIWEECTKVKYCNYLHLFASFLNKPFAFGRFLSPLREYITRLRWWDSSLHGWCRISSHIM